MADMTVTVGDTNLVRLSDAYTNERINNTGQTLSERLVAAGQTQPEQKAELISFMEEWFYWMAKERVISHESADAASDYRSTAEAI